MEIESKRLVIGKFTEADIPKWSEIENDPAVRRFIDGKTLSFDESAEYIQKSILHYSDKGFGRYAVRLKANGKLIGMCGFLEEEYGVDFGYRYTPSVWKQGIGFEAARTVLDYGLKKLPISTFYGIAAEKNYGSIRILEQLGFKFLQKVVFHNIDAVKYIIYKDNI